MPTSKHRRKGKTRTRNWVMPERLLPPPTPRTEEDLRRDAVVTERLHKLFGPPCTIHQFGDIDWSYDQYDAAITQLQAEGAIPPDNEL